jgi:anthranilate synthase/aminodeoxychorismate synthase-like glutamine amidotransferase
MYLIIDNYDSFVYNLVAYFNELGETVKIVKNDKITVQEIEDMEELKGIVISSGPKSPEACGVSNEVIKKLKGKIPILGVCLGHQIIGYEFGAKIEKSYKPMHGKVTTITHRNKNLFYNLPQRYHVTRYHSLVIDKSTLPPNLTIDALAEDGTVMAVSDRKNAVYGVQFNPEAVLTEFGHELLKNYIILCEEWRLIG